MSLYARLMNNPVCNPVDRPGAGAVPLTMAVQSPVTPQAATTGLIIGWAGARGMVTVATARRDGLPTAAAFARASCSEAGLTRRLLEGRAHIIRGEATYLIPSPSLAPVCVKGEFGVGV